MAGAGMQFSLGSLLQDRELLLRACIQRYTTAGTSSIEDRGNTLPRLDATYLAI